MAKVFQTFHLVSGHDFFPNGVVLREPDVCPLSGFLSFVSCRFFFFGWTSFANLILLPYAEDISLERIRIHNELGYVA